MEVRGGAEGYMTVYIAEEGQVELAGESTGDPPREMLVAVPSPSFFKPPLLKNCPLPQLIMLQSYYVFPALFQFCLLFYLLFVRKILSDWSRG